VLGAAQDANEVEQVLSADGRATGVRGAGPGGPFEVAAETVVLAAAAWALRRSCRPPVFPKPARASSSTRSS